MKLFRRSKSTQSNVPLEVAQYYQAERKDRRSVAWLMTILTLLVTAAIVIGFFLAGRWLYRTVRHDKPAAKTGTTSDEAKKSDSASNSTGSTGSSNDNAPGSDGNTDTGGSTAPSTPAAPTAPATPAPTTPATPAPTTPTPSQPLTNTGPGDTALITFVAVSVLAYVAFRLKLATQKD